MKIDVAYTCVTGGDSTLFHIARFIASHHAYPGGMDHRIVAIFNGGPPPLVATLPFESARHAIYPRSNDGWDIGGYIDAAHHICGESDIMICLGESVHFHKAGWLARIVDCWNQFGEGMYGFLASNLVRPHLQTTAFVTSPRLLRLYPQVVNTKKDRYEFEHGKRSFLRRVEMERLPVRLITWDGCWTKNEWRAPQNVLWKGDQSNCLVWCNHTEHYAKAAPKIKASWEVCANGQVV